MQVQIMPEAHAERTPYNPFDLTTVCSHADYPPIELRDHGPQPQYGKLFHPDRDGVRLVWLSAIGAPPLVVNEFMESPSVLIAATGLQAHISPFDPRSLPNVLTEN
jgi:hypothetical protein